MNPAAVDDRCRVSAWVSLSTTALATVISSPSRSQATPRAMTIRVWNGDHGNRSIRAGMRLRITPGAGASRAVVIERLRAWLCWGGPARSFPFRNSVNRRAVHRLEVIGITGPPVLHAGDTGHRTASFPLAVGMLGSMQWPEPRGPLSRALFTDLANGTNLSPATLAQAERT